MNLKKVVRDNAAKLLKKENVIAVGYGFKKKAGSNLSVPSIICSVTEKKPLSSLRSKDLVPRSINGYVTDVVEIGEIKIQPTSKHRPAPGGVSVGHTGVTAGTLGAWVRDSNGNKVMLSNNHVLANSNNASIGDVILQPGPHDGGTSPDDIIANLSNYVEINFGGGGGFCTGISWLDQILCLFGICNNCGGGETEPNLIDAAIAMPVDETVILDEIINLGSINGVIEPEINMGVKKFGRTTFETNGFISQLGVTVDVNYGTGTARFEDQIIVSSDSGPFSQGGDSGSVVLDGNNNAVGLLFAGSDTVTVLNRMTHVFDKLSLSL